MRTGTLITVCLLIGSMMLLPTVSTAQAVWANGTITKSPWHDRYIRIGVNDITYTFLNENIRIAQPYEVKPGMYNERKLTLRDLTVGQDVMIRAQGHRIYEIRVVEGR